MPNFGALAAGAAAPLYQVGEILYYDKGVRALRNAGYDGVVLGRVLSTPRADELLAQIAADGGEPRSRVLEAVRTP